MARSPQAMMEAVVRNLKDRTGKSLDQWVRLARKTGMRDAKELRRWLKAEHGLGQTTCFVVADATLEALGVAPPAEAELLDFQFKGEKSARRHTVRGK